MKFSAEESEVALFMSLIASGRHAEARSDDVGPTESESSGASEDTGRGSGSRGGEKRSRARLPPRPLPSTGNWGSPSVGNSDAASALVALVGLLIASRSSNCWKIIRRSRAALWRAATPRNLLTSAAPTTPQEFSPQQLPSVAPGQVKSMSPSTGSSCHQCKSRRSTDLNICSNMYNLMRGRKQPVCRKKYCDRCLLKFLGETPSKDPKARMAWKCPACRGICACAACRRRKMKLQGGSPALTSAPRKQKSMLSPPPFGEDKTPVNRGVAVVRKVSPTLGAFRQSTPPTKRTRRLSAADLLKRTAQLALQSPLSAPLVPFSSTDAMPMPSLSLGSRALSPSPNAKASTSRTAVRPKAVRALAPRNGRVAHIFSHKSTIKSIKQQLARLSELSNVEGLGLKAPEVPKPAVAVPAVAVPAIAVPIATPHA